MRSFLTFQLKSNDASARTDGGSVTINYIMGKQITVNTSDTVSFYILMAVCIFLNLTLYKTCPNRPLHLRRRHSISCTYIIVWFKKKLT